MAAHRSCHKPYDGNCAYIPCMHRTRSYYAQVKKSQTYGAGALLVYSIAFGLNYCGLVVRNVLNDKEGVPKSFTELSLVRKYFLRPREFCCGCLLSSIESGLFCTHILFYCRSLDKRQIEEWMFSLANCDRTSA